METLKSLSRQDYLKYALHSAVLGGVLFAAIKYLNGEEVWAAIRAFDITFAPFILLLATAYLLLKAWRFVLMMAPFDDNLPWLVTFKAYVAGQAATLLPGGVAARAGLMKQVDVPVAQSSVPVLFSSAIDQAIFVVGALVAALWFEPARMPAFVALGVLSAVTLIFIVPVSQKWVANSAEWLTKKLNFHDDWQRFLDAFPQVFTWRIMLPALALTLLAFAGWFVALDLSMRGVGVQLSYPTLFLGLVIPTMLGRLVPIPGGVGVTEATMVGFLTTASDAGANELAAAVAIFRIGTIFFQALIGAVVYYAFWRGEEEMAAQSAA